MGGERAGALEVRYAMNDPVPDCIFLGGTVATLESLLELCGRRRGW